MKAHATTSCIIENTSFRHQHPQIFKIMHTTILSALRAFPQQLEEFFELVPKEYAHWSPASWEGMPSETLTAIEQICHVRDIEIDGYHVRFARMLAEEKPTLESIDGYALAVQRRYAEADPAEVFSAIRVARSKTLELLEGLSESQLNRSGFFDGYGHVTAKSLIHFLCSHDQQHLAGMQWLLGQIASDSALANTISTTSLLARRSN